MILGPCLQDPEEPGNPPNGGLKLPGHGTTLNSGLKLIMASRGGVRVIM